MATKPGVLRRVENHGGRPTTRREGLKGEETVAKAAGGTVEDLLSGPKAKSPPRPGVKKSKASLKTATKNHAASKHSMAKKTREKPTTKTS